MPRLNSLYGNLGVQLTESQRVQGRKVACLFSSSQTEKTEKIEVTSLKPGQPGLNADWPPEGVAGRWGSSPGEPAERWGCFPEAPVPGQADAAGVGRHSAEKE